MQVETYKFSGGLIVMEFARDAQFPFVKRAKAELHLCC